MAAHPKFAAYLASVGKPVVTESEREKARELRAEGLYLREIAERLGRVKSTIHHMLKDGKKS